MARRSASSRLGVYLNSRPVGELHQQTSGAIEFRYDAGWLSWEHALPISLSLPLREDPYRGETVSVLLDNLLPDSPTIRRRIAERVRADGYDAYNLLTKIGRDCVGALQFLPRHAEPGISAAIECRPVSEAHIAGKLRNLTTTPLGIDDDEEFRISLAGTQEKTALLFHRGAWQIPVGTTPTTHILKPQIGLLPNGIDLSRSVENEYLCMKLAKALGLPTAAVEIQYFEDQRVLVVERFDRRWTTDGRLLRVPQEDLCQALSLSPTRKYESDGGPGIGDILQLLKSSNDPETDRRYFLKAQIAFWLLGATDGHGKNFSIFLQPGGRFRSTPLYDVMSAQPAIDTHQLQKNKMKMALAVGKNHHYVVDRILPRHFIQTSEGSGIPDSTANAIFTDLLAAGESAIAEVAERLPDGFPHELRESIFGGLRKRLRILNEA